MQPVAYYKTAAGSEVPLYNPEDLESAPIRFKLGGDTVAFMLAPVAEATYSELRFNIDGSIYGATEGQPGPAYHFERFLWDATVNAGEEFEVDAEITNKGTESGPEEAEYRIDGDVYDTVTVDLEPGETDWFWWYPIAPERAGEYTHSIHTQHDEWEYTPLEVLGEAEYTITAMNPSDLTVTQGDDIEVQGTIENTGHAEGAGEARYHIGDRHADTQTTGTLDLGDSETLTFTTTASESPGHYTHMITTDDDMFDGDLEIQHDGEMVDDFAHDQLGAFYQNSSDHSTTTAWYQEGGRSLNNPSGGQSSMMRSFPQGNAFRDHNFSLDRYPERGDRIRVVCQAVNAVDTNWNSDGYYFWFKFNCGGISNDFEYLHEPNLMTPRHTFRDRYADTESQEDFNESFAAGSIVEYVFDWNNDNTVDVRIYRNGSLVKGPWSHSVSPPGSDAGIGFSLRGGGDSIRVDHVIVE